VSFDDNVKIYLLILMKKVSTRGNPQHCQWHLGWEPMVYAVGTSVLGPMYCLLSVSSVECIVCTTNTVQCSSRTECLWLSWSLWWLSLWLDCNSIYFC